MMGKVLFGGAAFCLAGAVLCTSLVLLEVWRGDDLEVLPSSVQDIGVLRQGEDVVVEFGLWNRTSVPLRLLGASASCGCTAHTLSRTEIAPGESAVLTITFNTSQARDILGIHGVVLFRKAAEGGAQATAFHVQARIDPDYDVEPKRLCFGAGRPPMQRVALSPRHMEQLRVGDAVCDKSFFRARTVPTDGSQHQVVEVTFLSQEYYVDAGAAHVAVTTNSQRQPTIRIPLDVSIDDAFPGEEVAAKTRR